MNGKESGNYLKTNSSLMIIQGREPNNDTFLYPSTHMYIKVYLRDHRAVIYVHLFWKIEKNGHNDSPCFSVVSNLLISLNLLFSIFPLQ